MRPEEDVVVAILFSVFLSCFWPWQENTNKMIGLVLVWLGEIFRNAAFLIHNAHYTPQGSGVRGQVSLFTPHPSPFTLHPSPFTLHSSPFRPMSEPLLEPLQQRVEWYFEKIGDVAISSTEKHFTNQSTIHF